jgi:hypothetical protein
MKYFLLTFPALTLFGCVQQTDNNGEKTLAPMSSAHYKPINRGEDECLKKADKSILPYDVRNDFKSTENKSVIWTGIVDTVIYSKPVDTVMLVDVYLQHRYYDFIEDFSVQQEKMFVSPFGEGKYVFRKAIVGNQPFEEIKRGLEKSIFKECLIFSYGVVAFLRDSTPCLNAENIRIVFPENYATNIFSYKAQRDKNHKLVLSADGQPNLIDFQRLMVPKPGRNQLGSRLNNSAE